LLFNFKYPMVGSNHRP